MFEITRLTVAALAFSAVATAAMSSKAYDLVADWSNSANPNGPWSYREGTTILPFNPSWTAGVNFPVVQPAYQPGNVIGNFLPAWFKATSSPANTDWQVGDVVVHTNDSFNGNPAVGRADVLFTTPIAGNYDIAGLLWNASVALVPSDFAPRPQDWELLINGVVQASGVLPGLPGNVSRANPQIFDIPSVTLNVGDAVELDIFKDPRAQAGFFVGTDLTIIPAGNPPVPEPASLSILLGALAGLGLVRLKRDLRS